MKKLELKLAGMEMLSKEQMKMINGGEVDDYFYCVQSGSGGDTLLNCGFDACTCQATYDQTCLDDNNCDNVDCGCK